MNRHIFRTIEGHTEGMPVRMVYEGAPELQGAGMSERRLHFVAEFDWMRRALMLEPRGHGHMSGTFFYPPVSDNADCALLFAETSGCLPMCGHATLGSITFALECGLLQPRHAGEVVIDVPAGQVRAQYVLDNGKARVRFANVPSFLLHRDLEIDFPPLGKITFDIAYGGNFYPIIEVQDNYPGCSHFSAAQLLEWGWQVQQRINEKYPIVHPENKDICGVKHCMWTGAPLHQGAHARSVVIAGENLIDRSPCGTGTSARTAQRHARGWLAENQAFVHESVIGSRFTARVEVTTPLRNGLPAVIPTIEGTAWVTGRAEYVIDRAQPWWNGFSLSDFAQS